MLSALFLAIVLSRDSNVPWFKNHPQRIATIRIHPQIKSNRGIWRIWSPITVTNIGLSNQLKLLQAVETQSPGCWMLNVKFLILAPGSFPNHSARNIPWNESPQFNASTR